MYGEDKPIKASGELTIYEGTIDRANSDIYANRVADRKRLETSWHRGKDVLQTLVALINDSH